MADTDEVQTPVQEVSQDTTEAAADVAQDDVALEDMEISEAEIADEPEESDSSDDTKEEASAEPEESEELEESEDTLEAEEEDTPSEKPKGEPDPEMAKEAYKRREAERKLREERNAREQENLNRYLQEADDDEVELAKRQLEVQQYQLHKQQSAFTESQLELGIQRAYNGIDLLKDKRPEIQEEFSKALDDFERMYVVKDNQGNPVEVKADVYQYLQDKADSIRRIQGVGERKAGDDLKKAKAATIKPPSRTPKEPKQDSDLADFDSAWQ